MAATVIRENPFAKQAYQEIEASIIENISIDNNHFVLNNSSKNCNGVVPIKEKTYEILEEKYLWFREKPLSYFCNDTKKGGPIDVYKEFSLNDSTFKVGLEFETGNISSAHRSMNKLCIGIIKKELDMAFLMMPIKQMSYYLTDRVSNYEELEPYFLLLETYPFVVFGFDAEEYNAGAPLLNKGKDGMSLRTIRKWQNR